MGQYSKPQTQELTQELRSLMQQVGIPSFKALSRSAGVSEWQVEQLRRGKAAHMRVEALHKLSQALQISLVELLNTFSDLAQADLATPLRSPTNPETETETKREKDPGNADAQDSPRIGREQENSPHELVAEMNTLKQEYQRLQTQLIQQRDRLQQEFQHATLQILETWLTQFPTLVHAAQHNANFPAKNFVVFMRPVEQLIQAWGIEAIAPVGAEVPYDPHLHQLMQGAAQPGDRVKVRYTGYRQGDRLLYRARVSPITS